MAWLITVVIGPILSSFHLPKWRTLDLAAIFLLCRAYCGYGDAALPPLYFFTVGAICHWHLLPLWGLLLLLLPMLGFGVHFLVFKGTL